MSTGRGKRRPDELVNSTRCGPRGEIAEIDRPCQAPPEHLSPASRDWWRAIAVRYELEPHHERTLQAACEAWDRGQQARELVQREGLTSRGARGQIIPHPAVAVERDSRVSFLRALRELNLDAEQGPQ